MEEAQLLLLLSDYDTSASHFAKTKHQEKIVARETTIEMNWRREEICLRVIDFISLTRRPICRSLVVWPLVDVVQLADQPTTSNPLLPTQKTAVDGKPVVGCYRTFHTFEAKLTSRYNRPIDAETRAAAPTVDANKYNGVNELSGRRLPNGKLAGGAPSKSRVQK